jgi:hypothetical protein
MMNDPHVDRLVYQMKIDTDLLKFKSPPALSQDYQTFRVQLEDGTLTVKMKEHYASVQSAKERIEEFIRSWEISAALDFDWGLLRFEYMNAEVTDREPFPIAPGQITGYLDVVIPMPTISATATTHPLEVSFYPAPPKRFRATPDVETMWFRYQQHLQDKETYQSMGYFCLSLMQWTTHIAKGARAETSRLYNIDCEVLDTLGKLTSVRGIPKDARKLDSKSVLVPLTDHEKQWIREAVKALIRRKGEYDFDPLTASFLQQVTMTDLLKL